MSDQIDQLFHRSDCHLITATEAEMYLRGSILSVSMPSADSCCLNYQSCDCWEVLISTDRGLLLVRHEAIECADEEDIWGRMQFFSIDDVPSDLFDWKVFPPKDGSIRLKKIHYDEIGRVEAIKFLYGSRILYLFAFDDTLVVTKSVNELAPDMFEDEKGYPIVDDDSILFESMVCRKGESL